MEYTYWQKQSEDKPLYPDIEWSKPQQLRQKGRLGIIGGNALGFAGVAESYSTTLKTGVGSVRVLLPDVLKKSIPKSMTDVIYGTTNPSGGLANDSNAILSGLADWADGILMIGDAGRNSETAILYENFLIENDKPLVISRDAVDLLRSSGQILVERPNTILVLSLTQLQKLLQSVYYPKVVTMSMQTANLVEVIHKFTISYPISIVVFHNEQIIAGFGGEIRSMAWTTPMDIWRGKTASLIASYWLWNPSKPLESIMASLISKTEN